MIFFFAKIGIFCNSIAGPPSEAYTQPYSFGRRIKLIICQIRHELSVTYIIGHYNPSVRITAQHLTPLILCALILYVSGGTYSLTSTANDRFLRNFFMACLFTLRIFVRNLLRGSRRRNIFHISFLMTDLGYESILLRLINRHTTYETTASSSVGIHEISTS